MGGYKMKKILFMFSLLIISFISGCTNGKEFTIQFETYTGSEIDDIIYEEGSLFELPNIPLKEGHEFLGWYYDEELTERFTSKEEITRDLVLYAKYGVLKFEIKIMEPSGDLVSIMDRDYGFDLTTLEYGTLYSDSDLTQEYTILTLGAADLVLYVQDENYIEVDGIFIGSNIYAFQDNFMNGLVRPELERYVSTIDDVTLHIVDSQNNQALLNDQVDVFISQGVDVLLINLVNPSSASTIISKAKDANIPLIFFMKEPVEAGVMDTYDKVWYVGVDMADAGIKQGEMIIADWLANPDWDLNDDGILDDVLLKGEPGHPDAEARTFEVLKTIIDSGITVNELALQASYVWSTAEANNTMETWLSGSFAGQIEVVICNNDGMAFGAIQAIQAAGYDIPVYGIDALLQALDMIGDGEMQGTVLYDGVTLAKTSIDMAINVVKGFEITKDIPYTLDSESGTKAVRIPFVIVNIENYQDYQ